MMSCHDVWIYIYIVVYTMLLYTVYVCFGRLLSHAKCRSVLAEVHKSRIHGLPSDSEGGWQSQCSILCPKESLGNTPKALSHGQKIPGLPKHRSQQMDVLYMYETYYNISCV